MKLEGTYTAMITPIENGVVDIIGFQKNIQFQIESGVNGLVVLGTTGEAATLSYQEQEAVVKAAVKQSVPVIVGTGTNSTQTTLEKTLWAQEIGADAALIIAPYYNLPTQEGIYRHYSAIAHAVQIPIIIYNHKPRTGVNIQAETMGRIAKLPNVCGVKDATGDLDQVAAFTKILPVLSGNDEDTFVMMTLGAKGVISSISNLFPREFSELVSSALNGDYVNAQERHTSLIPLFKALGLETNPIPIKTAMQLCGFPSGEFRLPLCEMSEPHKQELVHAIENSDVAMTIRS